MRTTRLAPALAGLIVCSIGAAGQETKLACDGQWGGKGESACEMRESRMAAAGRLEVEAAPNGSISVKGWDKGEVLVRAQVRANAETKSEAEAMLKEIRVVNAASKVEAEGPQGSEWKGRNKWWSVSYEIFVPRRHDLKLHSVNGGISLSEVSGTLEVKTVNGGLRFAEVAGTVKGDTVNGGITMDLDGSTWQGEGIDLQAVNGGVRLNVPAAYSARIEASTVHGGLNADFGSEQVEQKRLNKSINLTLGSGGPLVRLRTVNGGVTVKKAS